MKKCENLIAEGLPLEAVQAVVGPLA